MRSVVAMVALVGSTAIAAAQPVDEPPPPEPPVAPPDLRNDQAWKLYHDAFAALTQGDRGRTRALIAKLQLAYPTHAAAQLAGPILRELGPEPVSGDALLEQPTSGARAELALFQTFHGMFLGIELCGAGNCNDGSAAFLLALGGAGAGAIASLSVDQVTSGQRSLVNSGTAWGAVNAALVAVALDPVGDASKQISFGLIAGQLGGLGIGVALSSWHPTAGQVALANSGGIWAGVITALAITATTNGVTDQNFATVELVTVNAGLIAGALVASYRPDTSRAQTFVIDAGGLVGAFGGGAAAVLISGHTGDHLMYGLAGLGAAVGLGTAAFVTRNWGDRGRGLQSYVLPVERGRGGIAGVSLSW